MIKNIFIYLKHIFDEYKIYKLNNKYVVHQRDIGFLNPNYLYRSCYSIETAKQTCLINSCAEAHEVIKKRKEYEQMQGIKNKIKFATECYK